MPFHFRRRHRGGGGGVEFNPHACICRPGGESLGEPLDRFAVGSRVKVCCIDGFGRIAKRLAEMGFVPGTEIIVRRRAPLADPIEFELRGYLISLRREEAALVRVQPVASVLPNEISSPVSIAQS